VPAVLAAGANGAYSVTLPAGNYDVRVRPATGFRQGEAQALPLP